MRVWQLLLAGGAPSWDRDAGTARMVGRTSTAGRRSEGGVRVAEVVGSGDEVSCETSVLGRLAPVRQKTGK